MKKGAEEKKCENCTYYLRYYIKKNDRFMKIWQGHCTNKKPRGHFRKTDKACECWEEIQMNQAERNDSIKKHCIPYAKG